MSESTSTGDFPEVPYYKLDDYQALRASYDALAARLAEVEAAGVRYTTMTDKNLDRLAAKLEAAEARVRELEPDAERYRMLRQYSLSGSALDPLPSSIVAFTPNYGERNDFERLDKLVDDMLGQAARRADRATASASDAHHE